jgi:hypothetical protein
MEQVIKWHEKNSNERVKHTFIVHSQRFMSWRILKLSIRLVGYENLIGT